MFQRNIVYFVPNLKIIFLMGALGITHHVYADVVQDDVRLWQHVRDVAVSQNEANLATYPQSKGLESMFQQYNVNNAEQLTQILLIAINAARWNDVWQLSKQYSTLPNHNPALPLFAKAAFEHQQGHFQAAERQYRSILQQYPDFVRAQLDFARLLFEVKKNKEAKQQFSLLKNMNLPKAVQDNIVAYLNAIEQRDQWHGSLSFGSLYNSNVNESAGGRWCLGFTCATAPKPMSILGLDYLFSIHKHGSFMGNHGIFLRGFAYGKHYPAHRQYNDDTINLMLGYQWASARHTFSLAPVIEWGRIDKQMLYRSQGLNAQWQYAPSARWGFNIEAERQRLHYIKEYQHNNGNKTATYATISYTLNNQWLFFGGADWQKRTTQSPVNDYRQKSVRVGFLYRWQNGFSAQLSTTMQWRKYGGFNALLQKKRSDRIGLYTVVFQAPQWQIAGFSPSLTLRRTQAHSNVGWLYGYKKNEIGLKLTRSF